MHHECWRRRSEQSRDVLLSAVCCGGCWDMVPVGRKRWPLDDPDICSELQRPRTVVFTSPAVPVRPLVRLPKRPVLDDGLVDPPARRRLCLPAVSQTVQALDLPSPRPSNKRAAGCVDLLGVAMKRARM